MKAVARRRRPSAPGRDLARATRAPGPEPRAAPQGGLARLGRLRAVLRLGERAHAGPARRAVLARMTWRCSAGGPVLELGCGTGRITDAAWPRAGVPRRRHRSVGGDAGARARSASARQRRGVEPRPGARRHPPPAVSRRGVSDGDGAVRHPAVAAARARSDGDAGRRCTRARARRHVRPGAGRRPAVVGGVPRSGSACKGWRGAAAARTSRWSRRCARTARGA